VPTTKDMATTLALRLRMASVELCYKPGVPDGIALPQRLRGVCLRASLCTTVALRPFMLHGSAQAFCSGCLIARSVLTGTE